MARNHKFFFDADRVPRARGPAAEKILMAFLETDVQGSDHVCHDLMDDLVAIEDGSDDQREFIGNAHRVTIDTEGVTIEPLHKGDAAEGAGEANAADPAPGASGTTAAGRGESGSTEPAGASADGAVAAGEASGGEATDGTAAPSDEAPPARDPSTVYRTGRKHFREVLEDWEAFILDDDPVDDALLDDDYA